MFFLNASCIVTTRPWNSEATQRDLTNVMLKVDADKSDTLNLQEFFFAGEINAAGERRWKARSRLSIAPIFIVVNLFWPPILSDGPHRPTILERSVAILVAQHCYFRSF